MVRSNFHLHIVGRDCFEVLGKQASYGLAVLVRHQSHGDFGMGLRREDGLGSFACIAAPDAVYIQTRTDASALHGGITCFAFHLIDIQEFLVFFQVKRGACKFVAVFPAEFHDIVIKAFDCDSSVFVYERGYHVAEDVDRIGHGSAVVAGMEVFVRTCYLDFDV